MIPANNIQSIVDVQWAIEHNEFTDQELPSEDDIHNWVEAVLCHHQPNAELTVRIVNSKEITQLNQQYRQKDGPTNVLSFPVEADLPLAIPLLGDLVICATVVREEAQQQNKDLMAHWAHMVVHGTLHLLGFDHIVEEQAKLMEQKEIEYLNTLGFSNPYEVITHS